MNDSPLNILLVEDNEDHIFLMERAIRDEMGADARIYRAGSGEQAAEMLIQDESSAEPALRIPRPDLIVIDIQLPGRDGFWLVRTIKSHPLLKVVPVVIFTSSDAAADVQRAYQCGSNSYVCKPIGADEFARAIRAIPAYWSRVAHLPPREPVSPN